MSALRKQSEPDPLDCLVEVEGVAWRAEGSTGDSVGWGGLAASDHVFMQDLVVLLGLNDERIFFSDSADKIIQKQLVLPG